MEQGVSKSVLVIDTPKSCCECPLKGGLKNILEVCNWEIGIYTDSKIETIQPPWCPLKPLPEKDTGIHITSLGDAYQDGWNACINAITGGDSD